MIQRNTADVWLDMVFDISLVGLMRRGTYFQFGAVLKPHIHPLTDGIFFGFDEVDILAFLDGGFEFFFHLRL